MGRETLDNPFHAGKAYRADELGDVNVQKAHWRITAKLALGVLCLSILGNVAQGLRQTVRPYYILEGCGGISRVLGPAPETFVPRQDTIKKEIREFVEALRRVPQDRILMQKDWSEAGLYAHVTKRGRTLLNEYAVKEDPLHHAGTVKIEVLHLLPMSEQTYDVRWQETRYSKYNEMQGMQTYRGNFHWQQQLPRTEQEIRQNPLGIFLHDWSFSKE